VFVASTVNVPTEVSIMYTIGGVPMVNNFTLGAGLVHKENISNTIMQVSGSLVYTDVCYVCSVYLQM